MRAQERRGDATIDWASVERMRALNGSLTLARLVFPKTSGEPTRDTPMSPAGVDRPRSPTAVPESPVSQAAAGTAEPASPEFSVRVDNVVPLRGV
jgi:hypothetical protein